MNLIQVSLARVTNLVAKALTKKDQHPQEALLVSGRDLGVHRESSLLLVVMGAIGQVQEALKPVSTLDLQALLGVIDRAQGALEAVSIQDLLVHRVVITLVLQAHRVSILDLLAHRNGNNLKALQLAIDLEVIIPGQPVLQVAEDRVPEVLDQEVQVMKAQLALSQ